MATTDDFTGRSEEWRAGYEFGVETAINEIRMRQAPTDSTAARQAEVRASLRVVESIPNDGFECYWIVDEQGHQVGLISGPQFGRQKEIADALRAALAPAPVAGGPVPLPWPDVEAEAQKLRVVNDDMAYAAYCGLLWALGYGTKPASEMFTEGFTERASPPSEGWRVPEGFVLVPDKPIGWFNPWNDYHGFQQVAAEYEGTPHVIPLYAVQEEHDALAALKAAAPPQPGGR